ncbi:ABC transporter permease [Paenarthrobacter nitroguajacolicus]|uniref:ABC transporter permease n=1 Tax=Paenarthrobacter nitroguajacolicus TaxID=211146 RepID=UPI000B13A212|nr:ABC transporter permease [Paenarthrobacter nitroguajacolicus]
MSAKTEQEPAQEASKDERVAASWRLPLTLRGVARYRLGLTGGCLVAFFVLFSFVGPMVYQSNQNDVDTLNALLEPSSDHLLGTDAQGFDVLGRLMKGGQISLQIGFFAALIATLIGTLYGAAAGLAGGKTDAVMMRFVDILMAVPFLFVALIVSTRFNPSVLSLSLVLGLFSWLVPARLVRSEVLSLRTRDYVAAAKSMGAGKWRLVLTHLIPNALGVVIVNITFQVADTILAVATLGFLGFGLSYPETDWGGQLSSGVNYLLSGYWWLIYPVGLCLVGLVLAFNLVGEALRDVVDKRRTV